MNKKKLLIIVLFTGLLVAIGAGAFAYFNISGDQAVSTVEQTEELGEDVQADGTEDGNVIPEIQIISSGDFKDGDAIHKGSGKAQIVEKLGSEPRLEFTDFSVTRGPDVFVYLSPNAAGEDLGEFISLGKIKDFNGNQSYNLPENYQDYKTVIIWCRAFNTTFASAELE